MKTVPTNIARLADRFPDIPFSAAPEDLICYGFDASGLETTPAAIIWPRTTDDVSKIMRYAYEENISVVPRGAGTGVTAGALPSQGSIVLSFEKMKQIIEIDDENLNVLCQPGVTNGRLQKELERSGLFYPPDPASMNFCTIGGNVAENAGGPRAIKYGVTRDYVMQIEAVLPDGEVLSTGVKTCKGVVGYDLVRLLTGSEGTLAVFTKIRLRVLPQPEDIVTLLAVFPLLDSAGDAVRAVIRANVIPRALEFMDRLAIEAVEQFSPTGLPQSAGALLLIELDGHPHAITREAGKVVEICTKLGGDVKVAQDVLARERLWSARRAVSPALYRLKPTKINQDIVVPRSRLTEMLRKLREMSDRSKIPIVSFGHAGDGNIHVNIMVDRADADEYRRGSALVEEIFRETLHMGGTLSGEHGVGLSKAPYLSMELSSRQISVLESIKRLFDPKNILNPGKIFP